MKLKKLLLLSLISCAVLSTNSYADDSKKLGNIFGKYSTAKGDLNKAVDGLASAIATTDALENVDKESLINKLITEAKGLQDNLINATSAETAQNDLQKIKELLTKASDLGSAKALGILGTLYSQGIYGFDKESRDQGHSLMAKAADLGDLDSAKNLGILYASSLGNELLETHEDDIKYLAQCAEQGDKDCLTTIVGVYGKGKSGQKDMDKALHYADKLIDLGEADIAYDIARSYQEGTFGEPNYQKAMEYYQKGAKLNDTRCIFLVGYMYENGQGVDVNIDKAKEWYNKACELDNHEACNAFQELN